LLECGASSMQGQILGCLVDLSDNHKSLPHITSWRGYDASTSAPHLFCELWRCEEAKMCVERAANGIICNAEKPLIGQQQFSRGVASLPATQPSEAIVDVADNNRAKIFALFSRIGFTDLPGLSIQDHITLTIIEHYLDLKVGEVWSEVMTELNGENVRPTTPDCEALEAISSAIQIRTGQIISAQRQLEEAEHQQDLEDEQNYYAQIRESHRQREKMTKDYTDYIERTSKHMMLKAAKERQELAIAASRINTNEAHTTAHRTTLPNLNTTTFCGRYISMDNMPTTRAVSEPQAS